MSVYNASGLPLSTAYGFNGTELEKLYDDNGEVVWSKSSEASLIIMTYNVQFFSGINSQAEMQNQIINKYRPDIIGMQELGTFTAETLPSVGQSMLGGYPQKVFSNHKNKVLMASKNKEFSDIVIQDFENQDPQDKSQYNETRAYMMAKINVGGKTVTFINTHLCYLTESVKWQQMKELFDIAQKSGSVIITGDFNSMEMSAEADDYIHMYKQFVDAGYHLANNSPSSGFHNTYTNQSTASSLADLQTAPDTIIVSPNISINSVVFDATKLSYLNGSIIDHIPVIAELTIN